MTTPSRLIVILNSIHQVLKAEKVLGKQQLPMELIPVPKEVNPDCGMALEIAPEDLPTVAETLKRVRIPIQAVYRREGKGFLKIEA